MQKKIKLYLGSNCLLRSKQPLILLVQFKLYEKPNGAELHVGYLPSPATILNEITDTQNYIRGFSSLQVQQLH